MPLKNPKTKYIFVSGGVLSSLGKGITTSSIALLLQAKGYRVTVVKCENYLNVDSGLINPIEHGDPFLCEDGTETDMDVGNYERFLGRDMHAWNFVTMGQIYKAVIDRERNYGYKGEDVEAIPHVTNEIESRIKQAALKDEAEICLVELGGTAGEYQNVLYYEASRIMKLKGDAVLHVHVSYLPTPSHVGEPKTKPAQLSVKALNAMSIQPDFLVARTEGTFDTRRRERLALFCNLKAEDVIINQDQTSIYQVPLAFHEQRFDALILQKLGLPDRRAQLSSWQALVRNALKSGKKQVEIAVVGKYFRTGDYNLKDSYHALFEALEHASIKKGVELKIRSINSAAIEKEGTALLQGVQGIIVPIGWGARGVEGKIKAIRYARENKIPYLGLCYGLQLAVVEYARNVLGLKKANSTEIDEKTPDPVIYDIPFDKKFQTIKGEGTSMRLGGWDCTVREGSLLEEIYDQGNAWKDKKNLIVSERHRHRYEVNNKYVHQLEAAGLMFTGWSPELKLAEFIELPRAVHPFFFATQPHPEYKSRPLSPHPIFLAFLDAASTSNI